MTAEAIDHDPRPENMARQIRRSCPNRFAQCLFQAQCETPECPNYLTATIEALSTPRAIL